MSEIKISDEARGCANSEIDNWCSSQTLASNKNIGHHIQLLLNQRDAELAELREMLAFAECDLAHDLDETGCCVRGCESCKTIQANPVWRKWKADPNFRLAASQAGAKGGEK